MDEQVGLCFSDGPVDIGAGLRLNCATGAEIWGCGQSEHCYTQDVKPSISHSRAEETLEAKARWFQSLPLAERLDLFCGMVNLALTANPRLPEINRARPLAGRIQVVAAP